MMELLPADVSPAFAAVLIAASFFTSAMTAAFGIGGGLALLAVMASAMPIATVVPAHGVVQLGSNVGRAVLERASIDWRVLGWYLAGSAVGAVIGGASVTAAPDAPLRIAVALFILAMVWGPTPRGLGQSTAALAIGGAVGGVLTMFFGATGPFTMALLKARDLGRVALVATFAACMSAQHVLKVAAFAALGFAFADWAPLTGAMIVTGFLGTLVGVRILRRIPEQMFRRILNLVLTALALHIAVSGLTRL